MVRHECAVELLWWWWWWCSRLPPSVRLPALVDVAANITTAMFGADVVGCICKPLTPHIAMPSRWHAVYRPSFFFFAVDRISSTHAYIYIYTSACVCVRAAWPTDALCCSASFFSCHFIRLSLLGFSSVHCRCSPPQRPPPPPYSGSWKRGGGGAGGDVSTHHHAAADY
jgi:hypothetical protein